MTKVPKIVIPLEMACCHLETPPNLPIIKSPKILHQDAKNSYFRPKKAYFSHKKIVIQTSKKNPNPTRKTLFQTPLPKGYISNPSKPWLRPEFKMVSNPKNPISDLNSRLFQTPNEP